jgi:hypothetical protein
MDKVRLIFVATIIKKSNVKHWLVSARSGCVTSRAADSRCQTRFKDRLSGQKLPPNAQPQAFNPHSTFTTL